MRTRKVVFIALAFALASVTAVVSQGNAQSNTDVAPAVTIHSVENVSRGKIGSFVLAVTATTPTAGTSGRFVNFKVGGTAVPGVDYVPLVSPTFIGDSGFGVILVKTLPDPRGSFNRQSYSVVVTLEPGAGYSVAAPSKAQILIEP